MPWLRDRLCDSYPAIRCHINVFVDGERAALDTPLHNGADAAILTAISGGWAARSWDGGFGGRALRPFPRASAARRSRRAC